MVGGGECKIGDKYTYLCSKFMQKVRGGLIIEACVMLSEYGTRLHEVIPTKFRKPFCYQTLLPVSHSIRAVSSNVYITVLVLTDQVLVI